MLEAMHTRLVQRHKTSDAWPAFEARLLRYGQTLRDELSQLYGERSDFEQVLEQLIESAFGSWCHRPVHLRRVDDQRERNPDWFCDNHMLGAVCYVDLFAGDFKGLMKQIPYLQELGITYLHLMPPYLAPVPHNDGGYAVSSYRQTAKHLGDIEELQALSEALRKVGISLVLDFVFNHTSNEHQWAIAAKSGDPEYTDYYYLFDSREMPEQYEIHAREIFPDEHSGVFSQLDDGRWVWTTFYSYQWDLNYSNPTVFIRMAEEMLHIANLGVDFLRMDAVAFVWKQLGTSCENLPQAHHLLRAYNAVARMAAPSLIFKSEAIVHPDQVAEYISSTECQISYNPLQMALLWNSLATREVNLLQQALEHRHNLPVNTAWVNYVRSHDDIGWTFADEDAASFGIDGFDHRRFLNNFYVNRFPESFARGEPFQDNPVTGDCRICGTAASLCGAEQNDPFAINRLLLLYGVAFSSGGIPLIYLGDEVATVNDYSYRHDSSKAADSRWVHRNARNESRYLQRADDKTVAGKMFNGLKHLSSLRKSMPAFSGGQLTAQWCNNPAVLGYRRDNESQSVLVLCNFSERDQQIAASVFSALPVDALDALSQKKHRLDQDVHLSPYQQLWLILPR